MTTPRLDTQTINALRLVQTPNDLASRLGDAIRLNRAAAGAGSTGAALSTQGPTRELDQVDLLSIDTGIGKLGPLLRGLLAVVKRTSTSSSEKQNAAVENWVSRFKAGPDGSYPSGVTADWNPDLVDGSAVFTRGFTLAQTLDIEMQTYGRDDQAGVLLDFGSNLFGDPPRADSSLAFSGLELEVAGNLGATTLSFSSGQTLGQIAAAINARTGETGTTASVQSGVGLILRSTGYKNESFISVDAINPGTADTSEFYFRSVSGPEDLPQVDTDRRRWSNSTQYTDHGGELIVLFNGTRAERVGEYWTASLDGVEVALDLDEDDLNLKNLFGGNYAASLGTIRSSEVRQQPDGTRTDFDRTFVNDSLLVAPGLAPGESLGLDFAYQEEPDAAGVFLDFGEAIAGGVLARSTTFEIGGPDGVSSITVVSGMTISQIVAAINSRATWTGVRVDSYTSGVGLVLRSTDPNPGAFVSVEAIPSGGGDPGEDGPFIKAYEVQGSGSNSAIVGEGTTLSEGVAFRDEARELTATINGQLAQFSNGYWSVHLEDGVDITISVDLEAILAAGGSVSLGSVFKQGGLLDRQSPVGPPRPRQDDGGARPLSSLGTFDASGRGLRVPAPPRLDVEA